MAGPVDPANFAFRMEGDFDYPLYLIGARVEEGMNLLSETTLEFVCTDREIDLSGLLGQKLRVIEGRNGGDAPRAFPGTCVSIEYLGNPTGVAHYRAVLRPSLWFLGRSRENRVFQVMTVIDIAREILQTYGFWGDVDNQVSGEYPARGYTIQYRETDLDFLCRLFEEEGIYFFFAIENDVEKMRLVDSPGAHPSIQWGNPMPFRGLDETGHRAGGHVFSWQTGLGATTGKITLYDYDFEKPAAHLHASNSIEKGTHSGNDFEAYIYPGRFRTTDEGEARARVRMEAEAVRHHTVHGAANTANLGVGETFEMADHPRHSENRSWLITRATHVMRCRDVDRPPVGRGVPIGAEYGGDTAGDDGYRVLFDAIPDDVQYRAPLVTPWPEIAGVHTAIVTGPRGEEIHTDKYGRIKVQFHWDRVGQGDEATSCWVRCMMPWSGKGWGMMAVPRIGQEVVVQFEEGNPDRPLVIGMLYNADTMPPWALDANKTQSGVKTNSTKGGGGFNELMMEDKKDAELVRFQAERDYRQIVKNDAEITVGLEHKDKGDMTLTVHRNLTETVKTGDHAFTVAAGKQTIKVKKDKDETIEGKSKLTVTGDVSETVKTGNRTEDIKMGNVTRTLDMGNEATTLKLGNLDVKCDLGKITMEAMQSIELKVGGSSIKIDQVGVTIKGAMTFKAEGGLTAEMKGALSAKVSGGVMVEVKGGAMLTLKGAITMIN